MAESTLDLLERLHREGPAGPWDAGLNVMGCASVTDAKGDLVADVEVPAVALIVGMHSALPALLRVARLAEKVWHNDAYGDALGPTGEWDELGDALSSLSLSEGEETP